MNLQEIAYTLLLADIKKISIFKKKVLLEKFGSASFIFEAVKNGEETGIRLSRDAVELLSNSDDLPDKLRFAQKTIEGGIDMVPYSDKRYPSMLRNIPDPPILLYKRGLEIPDDKLFIAIVGARKATSYGLRYTSTIARELAKSKVAVVSGMAIGIDAMAHASSLEAGGYTLAVLGSGLARPYPSRNLDLFEKICEMGTVISEYEPKTEANPANFPRRNRIIAGLSHGAFVAEASLRSGARITARLALEYERELFALPGNVDSQMSEGTNLLIRSNFAKLVTRASEILCEFGQYGNLFEKGVENEGKEPGNALSPEEENFLKNLKKGEEEDIETLSETTGLSIEEILDMILRLELKGAVSKRPGNRVILTD